LEHKVEVLAKILCTELIGFEIVQGFAPNRSSRASE